MTEKDHIVWCEVIEISTSDYRCVTKLRVAKCQIWLNTIISRSWSQQENPNVREKYAKSVYEARRVVCLLDPFCTEIFWSDFFFLTRFFRWLFFGGLFPRRSFSSHFFFLAHPFRGRFLFSVLIFRGCVHSLRDYVLAMIWRSPYRPVGGAVHKGLDLDASKCSLPNTSSQPLQNW
jgi:hypothetical protein